jgi:hypothetical protein
MHANDREAFNGEMVRKRQRLDGTWTPHPTPLQRSPKPTRGQIK